MNVWLFTRYLLALLLWLPVTPAFAEATSTEIEFWQSVKDSGDAEMLDAYLQEFPDGEFTELANIKIRKSIFFLFIIQIILRVQINFIQIKKV